MPIITYQRSCGSYIDLTKQDKVQSAKAFTVLPRKLKPGKNLQNKRATFKKKLSFKTMLGTNEFVFNGEVKRIQTTDPKNPQPPHFWYVDSAKFWATGLSLLPAHWCDAHITWNRGAPTVGQTAQEAPRLVGNIYVTIIDPLNKKHQFSHSLDYYPFKDKIEVK